MIRPFIITLSIASMVLFSNLSFAQQVTLNDLVNSENTQASKTSTKKWVRDFSAAENMNVAKEVLKAEFLKLEKSKHWTSLYTNGEITNELSFQTNKKMYVDRIIKDLKDAGFVLSTSAKTDNSNTYVYAKENVKVEVYAMTTETSARTIYLVTLL